ncbi:hypothetical protein Zmor_017357 [Zophobas morio]|uniref:Golgin subfamily A member 6-like protein 22 n=1 Tax=Zophobas morio TaxID=2755281 RepID=A0AA38MCK7_9CUCU|nr:hypothetical protein Zmor_017357 [Zophobas morio]
MEEREQIKQGPEPLMEMMKQQMEEMKQLREENRGVKKELQTINGILERERQEWTEKERSFEERINDLEKKLETKEWQERRNNFIITGMEIREKTDAKEVEEFLKKEIEVEVKVLETIIIGKEESKKILVKTLWEEKQEVMKNKNKLRGKRINIDNDWTVQEQKIQKEIREIAKEERKKGYTTRVRYKKLEVGDKMYTWNENKRKLEEKRGGVVMMLQIKTLGLKM